MKKLGQAPEFLTEEGLVTLSKGYMLPDETPRQMWERVSKSSASYLKRPEYAEKFFDLFWNNFLCGASPVLANSGSDRGLPISCFSVSTPDSIEGIFDTYSEIATMTKNGGGVGVFWGNVRGRGEKIKGNGRSDGIIGWNKVQDSVTIAVSQGQTRRGATASYLPIDHPDFEEFIKMRRPIGDTNRQCLNVHHAVTIPDSFMEKLQNNDPVSMSKWAELMRQRYESGEPYLMFVDHANNQAPQMYKDLGLKIETSNICNEIMLHTDKDHSFVCCLSSLNIARWHEWKNTDTVYWATIFLDGVMEEFIQKAKKIPYMERAVSFAEKSRALGLGVLGWHSFLQQERIGFEWISATSYNHLIFDHIDKESRRASEFLATEFGEPLWCKGYGVRNTHRMAIAPTVSNSIISGNVSAGIEPWSSNAFANKTAKGVFIQQNRQLKQVLVELNKDTPEVWSSISTNDGSVQRLDFLSVELKEVFKTARELDQLVIIKQAGDRQHYIDQSQSLNLFFKSDVDLAYFSKVHFNAWQRGLKGLYYCRNEAASKGDVASRENAVEEVKVDDTCIACES